MPPQRGRPQSPQTTERMLAAALDLLRERGLAGVTIEAVAARAGVSKAAIYRRFDGKPALVAAAIGSGLGEVADPPELGDLRREVRRMLRATRGQDPVTHVGLVGQLIAEQRAHPELIDAYREHVLLPRRAAFRTVVERAQRRGEVREDVDPELAVDLLSGLLLARVWSGRPPGDAWLDAALELWLAAVG